MDMSKWRLTSQTKAKGFISKFQGKLQQGDIGANKNLAHDEETFAVVKAVRCDKQVERCLKMGSVD